MNKLSRQSYSSPRYLIDAVSWAKEKTPLAMLTGLCSSLHKMSLVILSLDLVPAGQLSEVVYIRDF